MKRAVRFLLMSAWVMMATMVFAQGKVDQERMDRDIEIAENVLGTLLKQEVNKRNFFPYEIEGTYTPGFGVTFRVPSDVNLGLLLREPNIVYSSGGGNSYTVSGSYSVSGTTNVAMSPNRDCEDCEKDRSGKATQKAVKVKQDENDSIRAVYGEKIIEAAKTFITDYGDLLSQLQPEEKIMITNRGNNQNYWYGTRSTKRTLITVEATKGDIAQLKQGKINSDQFASKIKVVNTETIDELHPDLELLSSIFSRLYRSDLSKTYYADNNIYYERLRDFGVIYYMNVVSSNRDQYEKHTMPTLKLDNVDQETRDRKVKELYPAFEKEIKENILEYGRTLKSLKEDESLIFNIRMTKCEKCGIPSTLELSVKNSVLAEYNSGKLAKEAAIARINIKKGPNQ